MSVRILARLWPSGDCSTWVDRPRPQTKYFDWPAKGQKPPSALGLSLPVNSHKDAPASETPDAPVPTEPTQEVPRPRQKAKRGSGGLTHYGAKMLRSCCQLMHEKADSKPIAMLTNTLPSMSQEELVKATELWSEIMRQFCQELKRKLKRVGLPIDYAYVTEWQQQRGALHAHIVFIASNCKRITSKEQYPITKEWCRDVWQKVLQNVLGVSYDCAKATRIEKVKKHVGAYISKYISKGDRPKKPTQTSSADADKSTQTSNADIQRRHAKAWWGAMSALKTEVKRRVQTWERKIYRYASFRQGCEKDMWLEYAEQIHSRFDVYYNKNVVTASGIPVAIVCRFRVKDGWIDAARNAFFGRDISPSHFRLTDEYGKWRYYRDGFNPEQDLQAESEYIRVKFQANVYYGV